MLFTPPRLAPIDDQQWANWPRTLAATPAAKHSPTDTAALSQVLQQADGPVRVVGGNHSFTPLVKTDGTQISLDHIAGIESTDTDANTVWLRAGTRLRAASQALQDHGLAFKNLGDIDVQSIAGATATATHGTGAAFPCLSGEIRALRLMTAEGEEISIPADDPRLPGAQVALGALGIITALQMSVRPTLKLHRKTWVEPITDILAQAHDRWAKHRNYEFYYLPASGMGYNIAHEETHAENIAPPPSDDDATVMQLKRVRDLLTHFPRLRRTVIGQVTKRHKPTEAIDLGWKLLATDRNVPFNEMEYHLPVDVALDVYRDLIHRLETARPDVFFPLEVRMTAGDGAWLSPFQGGPRVSFAMHSYFRDDSDWFYSIAEPMFREAGGRPHWGKCHSLTARDLADIYPDFNRFCTLRDELDPKGRFVTPDMAALWGLA